LATVDTSPRRAPLGFSADPPRFRTFVIDSRGVHHVSDLRRPVSCSFANLA
jgi:hypothetical protein